MYQSCRSLPPYSPGGLYQWSPGSVPVSLLCVGSTQRRELAPAIGQGVQAHTPYRRWVNPPQRRLLGCPLAGSLPQQWHHTTLQPDQSPLWRHVVCLHVARCMFLGGPWEQILRYCCSPDSWWRRLGHIGGVLGKIRDIFGGSGTKPSVGNSSGAACATTARGHNRRTHSPEHTGGSCRASGTATAVGHTCGGSNGVIILR